jgi:putative transposase
VPRPPRIQVADVIYHVTTRAVDKQPLFDVVQGDREYFLVLVAHVVARYGWRLHAYCLMGNHFHLVVETPKANLAAGMRYLKGCYAMWFNDKAGREGTLFERRYRSKLVEHEAHAYELMRYVVLNPVRAKQCEHPRDWRWSSYRAAVGEVKPPPYLYRRGLHNLFGAGARGIALYERFVEDGIGLHRSHPAA